MSPSRAKSRPPQGWRELLKIEPGEAWVTGLLAGYLAIGIAAVVALKAAADSLFLSRFEAEMLPYADLAVTALVGLVAGTYLRLSNRWPLARLVEITQLGMAGLFVVLWYGIAVGWPPSAVILYVWVGIFSVLAPSQVWSLASSVLTTRQAKRLFSLIGSGGIAGAAIGGQIAHFAGSHDSTQSVLLAAAALMTGGAGLALALSGRMAPRDARKHREKEKSASLLESLRLVGSQRYLTLITASLFLSTIVSTLVKFQFKAVARTAFDGDQAALTAFFGDFYGYIAVFSFFFHVLFTSRLLRWFGLGAGLFVLPAALGVGGLALLVSPALWAAITARGADQAFRHSLDRASNELLYMPLADRIRTQVRSFLDVVVSRLADGVASLILLLLLEVLVVSQFGVSVAVLVGIAPWLACVILLRREYVTTLRSSIERQAFDPEEVLRRIADSSSAVRLATKLDDGDAQALETTIDWMRLNHTAPQELHLAALLRGSSPAIRRKTFDVIVEQNIPGYFKDAAERLEEPVTIDERWGLLEYLEQQDPTEAEEWMRGQLAKGGRELALTVAVRLLGHEGEARAEASAQLSNTLSGLESAEPGLRALAARLIGFLPESEPRERYLSDALEDDDPAVLHEAIRSAAALASAGAAKRLVDLLGVDGLRREARGALEAIGPPAVEAIAAALRRSATPEGVRADLLRVLSAIGDGPATVQLLDALDSPTFALRRMAGRCLARIVERAPARIDRDRVERGLSQELRASYQERVLLAAIRERAASVRMRFLRSALTERSGHRQQRIFLHLALLYPWREMRDAAYWIGSGNPAARANALEFLETRLAPQHRRLILPLLEPSGNAPLPDAARETYGLIPLPYAHAVRRLITRPDPWLQACGAYAAPESGVDGVSELLQALKDNPDALVRETARAAAEALRAHRL